MSTSAARAALVAAAERLIAERGPELPLRDIALAAGNRNNSAVHYHFGSRDGLIDAILASRLGPMEQRRAEMLDHLVGAGQASAVPRLVEILVEPMLSVPYELGSSHYARFVDRIRHLPVFVRAGRDESRWPSTDRVMSLLHAAVPLRGRQLERRIENLATVLFALAAEEERRRGLPGAEPSPPHELVSVLCAMLVAPA